MKLVVDGDIYAYTYAASNEEYEEYDGWLIPKWDMREMRAQWDKFIAEKIPAHTEVVVAFSDSLNFRKKVEPTYKGNRKGVAKPIMYKPLVDWIKETYDCRVYPTLEADDIIGLLVSGEGYVSVSEDKDMRTIPGSHFSLKVNEVFSVSPAEADYFWMTQTLTGDTVDGYSGIPGIGPAKAPKILGDTATVDVLWPKVLAAYRQAGLTEKDALTQARLARILRHGDYNLDTRKVTLWQPN